MMKLNITIAIIITSFLLASYTNNSVSSLLDHTKADIEILLQKLNRLELAVQEEESTTRQKRYFNEARKEFKQIEWLLHEISAEVQIIESGKSLTAFGELPDDIKGELSQFQLLEKAILKQDKATIFSAIKAIEDFVKKIELPTYIDEKILTNRIALQLYQHYILDLTGYYRMDYEENAIDEVLEALDVYLTILKDNQKVSSQISELISFLEQSDFNQLDRIILLKKYIQPICLSLSTKEQIVSKNIQTQYPLFSTDFLDASAFSDISDDLSTKPAMAELGQLLFFEPALSENNKRTCASCHKPQKAFTDGRQTSLGFQFSEKLDRNSPTLINVIFNESFGHDKAKTTLEEQTLFVIESHKEFNTNLMTIVKKLSNSADYVQYFQKAFPDKSSIDIESVLISLTAYMETIQSMDSDFDKFMRNEIEDIDATVQEGFQLFMAKAQCATCHIPPLFSGFQPISKQNEIGLHDVSTEDLGVFSASNKPLFKVPTLRNLAYTAPYMHNGYFFELDETFEHIFEQNSKFISLSQSEQAAIKAFVLSLSSLYTPDIEEQIELPEMNDDVLVPKKRRAGGFY